MMFHSNGAGQRDDLPGSSGVGISDRLAEVKWEEPIERSQKGYGYAQVRGVSLIPAQLCSGCFPIPVVIPKRAMVSCASSQRMRLSNLAA